MYIKAKKSLGQNFLIDREVLEKIVSINDITNKNVLEIGPGSGNLTTYILKQKPKKLYVVEKDDDLAIILREKFDNEIEIINDDILKVSENKISDQKLSVSPLTTHLALKDVPKKISKQKIYLHVKLITEFYKKKFNKKPKIAITGLNPHCESNFKNCEEEAIIIPAIKKLKLKKFNVDGPYPADTIFIKEYLRNFDVIIGMYHDQVLSPMKALFNFDAINITLGLPFTRVSPDHGPNYSMLGKNLSDPESLTQALKFLDK